MVTMLLPELLSNFLLRLLIVLFFVVCNIACSDSKNTNSENAVGPNYGAAYDVQISNLILGNQAAHYSLDGKKMPQYLEVEIPGYSSGKLQDVLNGQTKIIFFFSQFNCDDCVTMELRKIAKMINTDLGKNLLVLTNFTDLRSVEIFKKTRKIQLTIGIVKNPDWMNDIVAPCYFVFDQSEAMKDLYFPIKELPDFTSTYFRIMIKKYFKYNASKTATGS